VNVQAGAGNTGGPPGARSGMFVNEGGDCNSKSPQSSLRESKKKSTASNTSIIQFV
jgi:hypothetical protein